MLQFSLTALRDSLIGMSVIHVQISHGRNLDVIKMIDGYISHQFV
jgi:hypothetical protein